MNMHSELPSEDQPKDANQPSESDAEVRATSTSVKSDESELQPSSDEHSEYESETDANFGKPVASFEQPESSTEQVAATEAHERPEEAEQTSTSPMDERAEEKPPTESAPTSEPVEAPAQEAQQTPEDEATEVEGSEEPPHTTEVMEHPEPEVTGALPEVRTMKVGVIVYHKPSGTRCELSSTIRPGARQITVDGMPLDELIERGHVAPVKKFYELLESERLAEYDIDFDMGNSEWRQRVDAKIVGYALAQALANVLGRL